jgi:hypothetical protein
MRRGHTVVRAEARRRWGIVLGVVLLLCGIPVGINLWPVRAAEVDAAVLRQRILDSADRPYQGFAQSNGLLPLPSLPNLEQVTALASGTTQMRSWYAARDRWRVDVVGGGTERDLYRTPDAEYIWDFDDDLLSQVVGEQPVRLPRAADLTPPDLARRLLGLAAGEAVEPLAAKRVAGISAAGLRIVPTAGDTTVDHVDIWADPRSGLPLQAEVTARGGERPVFVSRFLEVHLSVPDADVLRPPARRPDAGFAHVEAPDVLGALNRGGFGAPPEVLAGRRRVDGLDGSQAVGVYGTGLARFVVLPLPRRFGSGAYDNAARFGRSLSLPNGRGALLGTGLLTVLVVQADRTFLVAGLVQPAVLERVAADLARAVR